MTPHTEIGTGNLRIGSSGRRKPSAVESVREDLAAGRTVISVWCSDPAEQADVDALLARAAGTS